MEFLLNLIEKSDLTLTENQRSLAKGFVEGAQEIRDKHREDINLIRSLSENKIIEEIVLSTDEVKIYKILSKKGDDQWDIKYPYRAIYFSQKSNKWYRIANISPSSDVAFLYYLQYKYLDANSQFAEFASKMLNIKTQ
jgi:hypothetical protein